MGRGETAYFPFAQLFPNYCPTSFDSPFVRHDTEKELPSAKAEVGFGITSPVKLNVPLQAPDEVYGPVLARWFGEMVTPLQSTVELLLNAQVVWTRHNTKGIEETDECLVAQLFDPGRPEELLN